MPRPWPQRFTLPPCHSFSCPILYDSRCFCPWSNGQNLPYPRCWPRSVRHQGLPSRLSPNILYWRSSFQGSARCPLWRRLLYSPYAVSVSADIIIDAACLRGLGSYANGARNGLRSNARFCVHPQSKSARLVATRRIRSGDEVIAAYGPGYWRGSGSFSTDPAPAWEWTIFPAACLLPVSRPPAPVGAIPSPVPASHAPVQIYAFADDLAVTATAIPLLFPALALIDSFSGVSGLGVNRDKSGVICSLGPSSYEEVINSLRSPLA